ncbi:MAG: lipopolysaccharide biosynthesis protein [Microscillaceae bacterium]
MSIAKKTIRGLSWTTFGTFTNVFLQILYTSWMARILSPAEFGIMAMATLVVNFATHFSKMGIGQAIIQKKELSITDIRAAFTLSISFGTLIFLLIFFSAPWIAAYFKSDELVPLLRFMGLSMIIAALATVSGNLLRKEMKFKQMSLINSFSFLCAYPFIGILLAWYGWGVWSLAIATLSQILINAIIQYYFCPHTLLPTFYRAHFRPILNYGSKVSLNGIITYLISHIETLFMGRFLGKVILGYYSRAHLLVFLPSYHLHQSLTTVLFPAFSKLQNNLSKLKEVYQDIVMLSGLLLFSVSLGMAAAAPECVEVVLGPGWEPSVPMLQVLCFIVPLNLLVSYGGIVCDAVDALREKILLNIGILLLMVLGFVLLRYQGVYAFLLILLLRDVLKTIFQAFIIGKIFKSSVISVLKPYLPGLLHGGITAALVWGFSLFMRPYFPSPFILLPIQVILAGFLLISQLLFMPHPYLRPRFYRVFNRMNLQRFEKHRLFPWLHFYIKRLKASHE